MLNTFNQDDIGDAHLHYCIFSCRNNESERIVTPISEGTLTRLKKPIIKDLSKCASLLESVDQRFTGPIPFIQWEGQGSRTANDSEPTFCWFNTPDDFTSTN